MNRAPHPIGVWTFARATWGEVSRHDEATMRRMAVLATEVLAVLTSHELLQPAKVVLKGWRRPLGAAWDRSRAADDEPAVEILARPEELASEDWLGRAVVEQARARAAFPMTFDFQGTGSIDDGTGSAQELPDIVQLSVDAVTAVAATVRTDVDVWLPCDLLGVRQWDVHERNAPRLRAALGDLAGLPGVEESHVEHTRYAVVEPLGVINHVDRFGRAVSVLPPEG